MGIWKVTTPELREQVRSMCLAGHTRAKIGRDLGVSQRQAANILRDLRMKTAPVDRGVPILPEQREEAIELLRQGVARKQIAIKLHLSVTTIGRIHNREFPEGSGEIEFEDVDKYKCGPCSERHNNATFTNVRPCVACACEKAKQGGTT